MHVRVSGPAGFTPTPAVLARAHEIAGTTGGSAHYVLDPVEAATDADVENHLADLRPDNTRTGEGAVS
jgi:ornithine carbamoyltransferase